MNLKYMKVSLFEITYKKKLTFSQHSNSLRCTCSCGQLLSQILAMNFCSLTTRGHSPITVTFTPHRQLQITQGLHFPSSTAPTQLFTLNHLTITITQSHTIYKLWTFSCSLLSIVSPATLQSVSSFPCLIFPCLIPACVFGFTPSPSPLDSVCTSLGLLLVLLDYLSA